MPLLEETGHMPSEKYARGPEILEHSRRIGRHYGLYDGALFHTEVRTLSWDDSRGHWRITTHRGDDFTAQFVGMGPGGLHVPKLPGLGDVKWGEFFAALTDADYHGPVCVEVEDRAFEDSLAARRRALRHAPCATR